MERQYLALLGSSPTAITQLWWLISKWQEVEQFAKDVPRIVRWLGHPWAGPIITVAGVLTYGVIVLMERKSSSSGILPDLLVGRYFHTHHPDGIIQFQGQVLREQDGRIFAQMYSFLDGRPTNQQFLTAAELETARFYDTHDAWMGAFFRQNPQARRWEIH